MGAEDKARQVSPDRLFALKTRQGTLAAVHWLAMEYVEGEPA